VDGLIVVHPQERFSLSILGRTTCVFGTLPKDVAESGAIFVQES